MSVFCKFGFHRWTENNKLSKIMMRMEYRHPFGCTRCGILMDEDGSHYPAPEKAV